MFDVAKEKTERGVGPARRVVMIGNFDGVHRGHQKLIALTVKRAKLLGAQPCALTFSPHPRRFFQGAAAPPMLTDDTERASLLQAQPFLFQARTENRTYDLPAAGMLDAADGERDASLVSLGSQGCSLNGPRPD